MLRKGIYITQETRHFDEARGITISLRPKEKEHDYRYFPEPDLAPVDPEPLAEQFREHTEVELPDAKRHRFIEQYDISDYLAKVLTASKPLADYFEAVAAQVDPSAAASWVVDVLQGELNYYGRTLDAISPDLLIDFITNVIQRTITKKAAVEGIRTVLVRSDENITLRVDEKAVLEIIDKAGLRIAPAEETITAVKQAIEENPQAVEDYHSGKTGALNFLVGRVMKKTRGRADPTLTNRLIREQL